jgi:succinate-semialdehyde dehydrogenase / glutarate-semialdehyde dehydrogenase
MSYQSVNPSNGKVVKKFKELSDQQLEKKLKTAALSFEGWRAMPFARRQQWSPKPPPSCARKWTNSPVS